MPRTSKARAPEVIDAPGASINHEELTAAGEALSIHAQQIALVEQRYDIGMAYDYELAVKRLRDVVAMEAISAAEAGMLLINIKEHTPGRFAEALERIGVQPRWAQRRMQMVVKMRNLPNLQQLGFSKVLELLSEDDDTLEGLEHGGTVAGLDIDDIDSMSPSELRKTLRAARQEHAEEKEADEAIIRAKDERINKLTRDKRKVETSHARNKVTELLADMDENTVEAVRMIRLIVEAANAIDMVYQEDGEGIDADVVDRINQNVDFAADWLRQLAQVKGE